MPDYAAPIADISFALNEIAGLPDVAKLPGCDQAAPDLVAQILEEGGKFAGEVLAPLNAAGDRQGARFDNGEVRTSPGFAQAFRAYVEAGWNALPFDPDYGGQGMPLLVATAILEMWTSANLAFSLCPMLTIGTVELLQTHGSPDQKRLYLAKLISGEWTGTMNLTEPQAGSDVGALRTRAVKEGDHYRITGQKIFITYGEHDMAPNIVHMVLARLPDAPHGTKGISLFLVPKFLAQDDGGLGARNDLRCVSIEHKLGIHGSPTCVLSYGDEGGAIGYLVGEENRGMECMFTMMNNARLNVGLQGVAIAERAFQAALAYARQRVQGQPVGVAGGGPWPIVHHPDVKRMLIEMKARIEAARALAYTTAAAIDGARHHGDAAERVRQQKIADLLIPVVKAWCTDTGVEVASIGIQIHGGMGYIEETGVAQYLRDARIAPIYEGTNGIQANDLIGRKLARDGGAAARDFIAGMQALDGALAQRSGEDFAIIREHLAAGLHALAEITPWLVAEYTRDTPRALAGAAPYLKLFGCVTGGWLLAKGALSGQSSPARLLTARFFAEHVLAPAPALLPAIRGGATIIAYEPGLS